MTNHTTKNTFKVRGFIAAMAAIAIPVMGIVSAQTAMAEPNQPTTPKASCTWGGQTTSDGGYHTETSGSSWAKYKCVDGTWVKDSSCDGNCNPPPPKTNPTNPTNPKFGLPTRVLDSAQLSSR
ncbi:MAG: hypothetical protein QOD39_583 [Mycobacterium sp.]|jgi:hypothetical protein|nr:hypothetical protein [Mycobacterium sp.]